MHHIIRMTIASLKKEYKGVIEDLKSSLDPYFQSPIEAIKLTSSNPVAFHKYLTINHGLKPTSAIFLLESIKSLLHKKTQLEKQIAQSHIQKIPDPLYKTHVIDVKIMKAKYSFSTNSMELCFVINPLHKNKHRFKLFRVFNIVV